MVNDQEPRYRLVDSNGNVVGSLFQNADGNVEIQDETGTGSVFGPDGIVTPAIDAESVSAETASVAQSGTVISSNSTQSDVPRGTFAEIEFDTVEEDNLDAADLANNRITIQENGDYLLHVFAEWEDDDAWATGDDTAFLPAVNGNELGRSQYRKVGDGAQTFNGPAIYRTLNEGDNVTGVAFQRSDGGEDIDIRDRQRELTVVKVG